MKKIYIIYKFTNTVTGDFYIGSQSIKIRCANQKYQSVWIAIPNYQLSYDMNKYGDDKFDFEILAEVEADKMKEKEQEFIEKLHPTYNQMNVEDLDIERYKKTQKEYNKTDKCKTYQKEYYNQLCYYNGETLTLNALGARFRRRGLSNPTAEAKKYLIGVSNE